MYKVKNPKGEAINIRVDRGQKITVDKYCATNKTTISQIGRLWIDNLEEVMEFLKAKYK